MSEHEAPAGGTDAQEHGLTGFLTHLVELRNRLLKSVLVVLLLFLALFPFRNELFTLLADPLARHMPAGTTMIAVQVASPFFIPLKLTALTAVFIAIPFLLYQLWAFIAPGLYKHERKMVAPLVFSSTILFYLGAAFAYFVVFPVVFGFLSTAGPSDVNFAPDIGEYLSFVTSLFFAFGFVFEVPVAIVLLVIVGAVTPDKLAEFRRYAILIAFIIGAILTPPDVLSQFMMAIPIWLLYEMGIVVGRLVLKTRQSREDTLDDEGGRVPAVDSEDDRTVTERHEQYEREAESGHDLDKAFDEAEAEQRRLDEIAQAESGQSPEGRTDAHPAHGENPAEPPVDGQAGRDTTDGPPSSAPPPTDAPPKKPGDPS